MARPTTLIRSNKFFAANPWWDMMKYDGKKTATILLSQSEKNSFVEVNFAHNLWLKALFRLFCADRDATQNLEAVGIDCWPRKTTDSTGTFSAGSAACEGRTLWNWVKFEEKALTPHWWEGCMWQIDVTSKMILQESGEHRNAMKYFNSFQRMETKNGRFNFRMADLQNFSHLFLELCLGKNPGVRQQMLKRSRDRSWKPSYERCEGFCSWDFQPTLDDTSRTGRSLWTEIPPKPTLFSINER